MSAPEPTPTELAECDGGYGCDVPLHDEGCLSGDVDPTPAPGCSRPSTWGSCIHSLASGWITASDLCPGCTHRFMAALDREVEGLVWHPSFLKRAEVDHG
jgi:hypothetical protein